MPIPRPTRTPSPPSPATRPRGRPRTFDRDEAVQTSLRLFSERGYQGTSIADLVAAIGISPPSLYAAFGSKEALFREALSAYADGRGAFVAQAFETDLPLQQQLQRLLQNAAAAFTPPSREGPPGCPISTDLVQHSPDDAEVAAHVEALRDRRRQLIARRIEAAKKRGEVPATTNAKALARHVAAVITGMAQQARDGARRADLLDIAEAAMLAWPRGKGTAGVKGR